MRIHFGSFLLGVVVGATGATIAHKFRPVAVEILALGFQAADALRTRAALAREALEDLAAEARARARRTVSAEAPVEERRAA
jgi:hypothetical protein